MLALARENPFTAPGVLDSLRHFGKHDRAALLTRFPAILPFPPIRYR